jgi:hypothetical protein
MKGETMKKHWTERSIKDYVFRIAADLIAQLEEKIELFPITQDELAKRLGVTKDVSLNFLIVLEILVLLKWQNTPEHWV